MPVLIATDLPAEENRTWRDALERALPRERFVVSSDEAGDAGTIDIAVVANPPPGALAGLPGLRLIQSLWAGVDRLLADPGLPADVPLARMVDPALAAAMAETALWAVLGLQRGFFDYAGQQAAREWRQLPQRRADETRVAVLGLGAMGRAVATRLAQQGLRVTGWSASGRAPIDGVALRSGAGALPSLLAAADIVVSLLPLTDATCGLFDAGIFASMRRGAGFVNLARGAQVVEADLLAALDSRQVGHAVLDVFAVEPLPSGHAFWSHPRVTLLPHVAALTDVRSAAAVVAANVRALREGRALAHLVDRVRGY